ncbi:hypothetical protein PG985_005282 [Apiospora marii]|uniref:Uncharacterized protein n=1 Tax=Apiospora marii TaxID=335849 RepID=A0ABR1SBU6_9PEZI
MEKARDLREVLKDSPGGIGKRLRTFCMQYDDLAIDGIREHDAADPIRSEPTFVIAGLARYLLGVGFKPNRQDEEHNLIKLAWHDFGHDESLDKRLMSVFLASLRSPDQRSRHELACIDLHEMLHHPDAGKVLFESACFRLVDPVYQRASPGAVLGAYQLSKDEVFRLGDITCTGAASPQHCIEKLFGLRELHVVEGQKHWVMPDVPDLPDGDISVHRRHLLCSFPPFLKIKMEGRFDFSPHACKDLLRLVVRADAQVASVGEPIQIAQLSYEYTLVAVAWGNGRIADFTTYDVQGRIRSSTISRPIYPGDAYLFYIRMSRSVPLASDDELEFKGTGK